MKHIVIDARIRRASTGRYIDRLVEHLQRGDTPYRYTVLVQPEDDWHPSNENFQRVESPYAQFSLNPLEQVGFARQLYSLKPDLVHFPMNQQPVFYFGTVLTSCMDLTMLRFTRPGRTPLPVFWVKMAAYRFLFWYSLRKSRAIIVISDFVRRDLEKHYPFTKGHITRTYCASEPPLPGTAEPLKGVRAPFIMHVGSPFPHKNIERLIDAFTIMKQTHPDLQLVLAGKREYYFEQLEQWAQSNPHIDDIVFTGFIPDLELKWLYEHAEAYVLPSESEGFGLPGLEAMAHGCPLVSSNATCLPEIYGDAAQYFDPLDIADIAGQVGRVLDDPKLRKQLVKRGYARLEKFSWETMAQQTLSVYRKILA